MDPEISRRGKNMTTTPEWDSSRGFQFFSKKKYSSCFKLLLNDRMFLWWRMRGFSTKQTRRTDEEGTQKARTLFFFSKIVLNETTHTHRKSVNHLIIILTSLPRERVSNDDRIFFLLRTRRRGRRREMIIILNNNNSNQ